MIDPRAINNLTRRRLLQFGLGGYLGLNLGSLWRAQAAQPKPNKARPIKACIFIFLYGGPSQLDTFDPKPDTRWRSAVNSRRFQLPRRGSTSASICRVWRN